MTDVKIYSMMGCGFCHQYYFPKWRLNAQMPLGSMITNVDMYLDPRGDTPKRLTGVESAPVLTIVKPKMKTLFRSKILDQHYAATLYSGVDESSNYALLKKLLNR